MATRSRIGVELPHGDVLSVYCHWDGYRTGVGKDLLNKGFNTTEEVRAFIREGSRSTVETSYHEWRGEAIVVREDHSVDAYLKSDIEEYGYLFTKEERWVVKPAGGRIADLKELLK